MRAMKQVNDCILTVNGGSSSIKFALFEVGDSLQRILAGRIDRIGLPEATFVVKGLQKADNFTRPVTAANHTEAVGVLMDWVEERIRRGELTAVGHRVVHGGPKYSEPQRITSEMIAELHDLQPFDPDHLPEEILLTEAFHHRFPNLVQVACFDTAFHHNMPRVAQLFPIPRRYEAKRRTSLRISWIIVCVSDRGAGAHSWTASGAMAESFSLTSVMVRAWLRFTKANPWIPAWVSHRPEAYQ